jgi:hypothetical protein
VRKIVFVEYRPDFCHPAVHHVRRGHHVGTRLGMGQGRFGQQVQCGVIVHGVAVHKSAVTVVGVFAQAHIGDDDQFRDLVLHRLYSRWTMPSLA